MERKNAWKSYDENNKKELEKLCKEYRDFLSAGKTERECVKQIIAQAESAGTEIWMFISNPEKHLNVVIKYILYAWIKQSQCSR